MHIDDVFSEMQIAQLSEGLLVEDVLRLEEALHFVHPIYTEMSTPYEQPLLEYILSVVTILATLNSDADTRIACILIDAFQADKVKENELQEQFGKDVFDLIKHIQNLFRLRDLTSATHEVYGARNAALHTGEQIETLRKMLLAMASDMRVILIELASRVTTLHYFAEHKIESDIVHEYAKDTLDLYAPLANRLGVWQMKWELEDFSFRFLQPDTYRKIAKMLEEKRVERESFIANSIERLKTALLQTGVKADVSGRPKHIYSIYNKLRGKDLNFDELYDVRAFRVIVDDVAACYTVLGMVHDFWSPLLDEFDDYISRPKANGYQSLHTIVVAEDGMPLEVQIRTHEMHYFAEYGVAAHWRYKEATANDQEYDEKIAWLRQLLAWQTDVTDAVETSENPQQDIAGKIKSSLLDERIYVLTPQARVIELPKDGTPIDFAYHLHSNIGHRCRGAKVDGVMVPLNTPLKNGQTVEIMTAKGGQGSQGPSRDWLSSGFAMSSRTRAKVRAWFKAIDFEETQASGRAIVEKTLQREGKTAFNLEELARKIGYAKVDEFFHAVGKETITPRQIEQVLHGQDTEDNPVADDVIVMKKSRAVNKAKGNKSGVLVVGTEGLMTQLAKCCKPAPPDDIVGFITRGSGVSIHRHDCKNFVEMQKRSPERVIQTAWGDAVGETFYPVNIFILASDRQGLLRDISDIFSREKINVVGVSTQSAKGAARMSFTAEVSSALQLKKALGVIREVKGVQEAKRF